MALSLPHGLYCVGVGAAVGQTIIGGITRYDLSTRTVRRQEPRSGEVWPRNVHTISQKPGGSITTEDIVAAIDTIVNGGNPLYGHELTASDWELNLFLQKLADGGSRAAGSVHHKLNMKSGIVVPTVMSCSHHGDAMLSYDYHATYDGTNDPVIATANQALPAAATANDRWTLHSAQLGGVAVAGLTQFDLNFNVGVEVDDSDSDIWPTFVHIRENNPMIRLRGLHPAQFVDAGLPLEGIACTHANSFVYLRKRTAVGSGFVADATEEHVLITFAGSAYVVDPATVDGNNKAEITVEVDCVYDGTNNPVVFDTTAALP